MKKKLSHPNPYDVLNVSRSASDKEITKAFTVAMKKREYPPDVIAKARKSLMNTQERLIADYLCPKLPTVRRFKRQDFSELETSVISWDLLPEFDGLEEEIKDLNGVSQTDKNLGLSLFI